MPRKKGQKLSEEKRKPKELRRESVNISVPAWIASELRGIPNFSKHLVGLLVKEHKLEQPRIGENS